MTSTTNPTTQNLDFTKFFELNKYDQKKFLENSENKIKKYHKAYENLKIEKIEIEKERDMLLDELSKSVPMIIRDELEKENNKNKMNAEIAMKELEKTQLKLKEIERKFILMNEEKFILDKKFDKMYISALYLNQNLLIKCLMPCLG